LALSGSEAPLALLVLNVNSMEIRNSEVWMLRERQGDVHMGRPFEDGYEFRTGVS